MRQGGRTRGKAARWSDRPRGDARFQRQRRFERRQRGRGDRFAALDEAAARPLIPATSTQDPRSQRAAAVAMIRPIFPGLRFGEGSQP